MRASKRTHPVDILLVEDSPGDVLLTTEALRSTGSEANLHTVGDGEAAMDFLHRNGPYAEAPRPDVILLDLNLPRLNGHEVLRRIKQDDALRTIPVIVLTTSNHPTDIQACYDDHANCFVVKPLDMDRFKAAFARLGEFWFETAKLPATVVQ